MAIAKSVLEVDAWAEIAVATIRKGAEIDLSAVYENIITVVVAQNTTNPHANGALITLQTNAQNDTDGWRVEQEVRTPGGTAVGTTVDQISVSGGNTLFVASTGVGDEFETKNDLYFVEAGAYSEVVRNNGFTNDVSITVLDALEQTHDPSEADPVPVFNVVTEHRFFVPAGASTARILVWNDDADCTIFTRIDIEKMTGV